VSRSDRGNDASQHCHGKDVTRLATFPLFEGVCQILQVTGCTGQDVVCMHRHGCYVEQLCVIVVILVPKGMFAPVYFNRVMSPSP